MIRLFVLFVIIPIVGYTARGEPSNAKTEHASQIQPKAMEKNTLSRGEGSENRIDKPEESLSSSLISSELQVREGTRCFFLAASRLFIIESSIGVDSSFLAV